MAKEADNHNVADTAAASSAEEANQLPQQSPDISDEEATSKKRKRGRPSLNQTNKVNNINAATSTSTSSSSKDKNAETQIDTWDELTSNCETRKHDFRFAPNKKPGVICNLNGDSTPLDCFFELFDAEVQDQMINFINSFAQNRLINKLPAARKSRFQNWYPVTRYELLKFFAVLIQMGIDKRPTIEEYWSLKDTLYSPWYSEQFTRNRFEIILHCLTRYEGTKPFSLKKFKDKLIHQLINEANACIPDDHKHHVPKQPTARVVRVQGPSHLVNWLPDARNCQVCSTPQNRKRTHFICITCNAYLHPKQCFKDFHSVRKHFIFCEACGAILL